MKKQKIINVFNTFQKKYTTTIKTSLQEELEKFEIDLINNFNFKYNNSLTTFKDLISYLIFKPKEIKTFQKYYTKNIFKIISKYEKEPETILKLMGQKIALLNMCFEDVKLQYTYTTDELETITEQLISNNNNNILLLKPKKTEQEKQLFNQLETILFEELFFFQDTDKAKRYFKHWTQGLLRKQQGIRNNNKYFISLIIQGAIKTGKSYFINCFFKALKLLNIKTKTTSAQDYFTSPYNPINQVVCFEEFKTVGNKLFYLKDAISNEEITIQDKFIKSNTQPNYFTAIMTSNEDAIENVYQLTGADRRFVAIELLGSRRIKENDLITLLYLYISTLDYSEDNDKQIEDNINNIEFNLSINQSTDYIKDRLYTLYNITTLDTLQGIDRLYKTQTSLLNIINKIFKNHKEQGITAECLKSFLSSTNQNFKIFYVRKSNNNIALNLNNLERLVRQVKNDKAVETEETEEEKKYTNYLEHIKEKTQLDFLNLEDINIDYEEELETNELEKELKTVAKEKKKKKQYKKINLDKLKLILERLKKKHYKHLYLINVIPYQVKIREELKNINPNRRERIKESNKKFYIEIKEIEEPKPQLIDKEYAQLLIQFHTIISKVLFAVKDYPKEYPYMKDKLILLQEQIKKLPKSELAEILKDYIYIINAPYLDSEEAKEIYDKMIADTRIWKPYNSIVEPLENNKSKEEKEKEKDK